MTPPAQSNTAARPEAGNLDEVLKLACPECSGTLNLRRKHIGIAGKCVHCQYPVTAVDTGEAGIRLACSESLKAAPFEPVAEQKDIVEPVVEANEMPQPEVNEISEPVVPAPAEPGSAMDSGSSWSVPSEVEEKPVEEVPPADIAPATPSGFDIPVSEPAPTPEKGAPTSEAEAPVEKAPSPSAPVEEEQAGGFDSDSSSFGAMPEISSSDAMFSEPSGPADLNEGWGTKPPTETHASNSPFATGSANEEEAYNSMGSSLFGESVAHSFGNFDAKSPFGDSGSAAPASSPLFAQPDEKKEEESDDEAVLDGDGRPLQAMTEDEKERFGKDMVKFGGYQKRSPWHKRIMKFFITVFVLCGLGYAGYYFMPDDMAAKVKAQVVEFLEPGSVLADFLPFEIGNKPETGEEGEVRIKAIDGFNQLTDDMDAYLDAAEQNLDESMGEENSIMPEREKKEKMEMPKIPKLPFELPGMKAGADETGSE